MKKTKEEIEKELEDVQAELSYWTSYQPVNNMGKWGVSVRIESIQSKIKKLENKLKKLTSNK